MNQSPANRRPSIAPRHTINTRAQGDAQMELPKAAHSAPLLQPTNRRGRSTNADGSFNNNVPYLILSTQSQSERRTLVTDLSKFLGYDMKAWHEALHHPKRLPENALDWSTVLLQRTYDLARSIAGNGDFSKGLIGVSQAMNTTRPNPAISHWVQAALDSRQTEMASSSAPSSSSSSSRINSSRSAEMKRLRDQVTDLQQQLADKELEVAVWRGFSLDEDETTSSRQTTCGPAAEMVCETDPSTSTNVVDDALSQPQDELSEPEEDPEDVWADYQRLDALEEANVQLSEARLKLDEFMSSCSSSGSSENDTQTAASNPLPTPPPSYHSCSSSEISEEL